MVESELRSRFLAARSVRLATVTPAGRPHVVPICFAMLDGEIWSAVDGKPKRTARLARLAHVASEPRVALLADHYVDDDWTRLWWVRVDGVARVVGVWEAGAAAALRALAEKYPQYRSDVPPGPLLAIRPERWSGWEAATGA